MKKFIPTAEQLADIVEEHDGKYAAELETLAALCGVSEATIRRVRRSPQSRDLTAQAAQEPDEGVSEEEILRAENKQLRAQVRKTDRESVGDERVLRAIEGACERAGWPVLAPPKRSPGRPRTTPAPAHHRQVALWSDWHAGETVSRAQMNGINEFNWAILEDRVAQLVESMLKFKAVRPELTGLDLWCLGDMASGAIHALEETNEIPAAEQYISVGYLIAAAIEKLAPHYEEIACAGIVGNHPRPGKEPASKDAYNNGDWIAYNMAKALTKGLHNVSWDIPKGGMLVKQVAGRNFLLWHGDGVRSSMPGVPWGGIMRRWNELKGTYASRGTHLDFVVVGHFHQACRVPGVFMNGSLIGPNEYGLKNFGGGEAAKQLLLTFDERRQRLTDIGELTFEEVTR